MMVRCKVCCGTGRYPVITETGRELYTVECPECEGIGRADWEEYYREKDAQTMMARDRERYEAAMREKRQHTAGR